MKKKNLIVIALIFVLLLATLGISVAVFSSLRTGNTDNTITLGDLKFHYTEITGVGNGINLVDPLPISDSEGKVLNGEREYFDFSIESNTIKSDIEYEVVVEPTSNSTVSLDGIKFYLTEVVNNNEQEIEYSIGENNKVKTLNEYNETEIENVSGRTVYSETIARNTKNYYKKFRARIWLSEDVDWTDDGYIGKTGSFKINVYAKGKKIDKQLTLKESVLYASNGGDTLVELPDSSFTRVSNEDENGLFKSTKTNTGRPTYYYRGSVDNNWVSFAGQMWRIVRVNEDGTVRLIMQNGINNNATYQFYSSGVAASSMYYSNSDTAKTTLNSWYTANITNEGYNYYVAKGNYYCEQAKVAWANSYITGNSANMQLYSSYNPNYQCSDDYYGHGLINSNIGLISYDEVLMAGGYYNTSSNLYLKNNQNYWTISTAGYQNVQDNERFNIWRVRNNGILEPEFPSSNYNTLRPVINIKANVKVIDGTGTQTDPYVIGQTPVYESNALAIASITNPSNLIMCDGVKGKLSNCDTYDTLASAVASRDKGTIIVNNDTTVESTVEIPATKEIVLELNGKKLESTHINDDVVWGSNGSHGIINNFGIITVNDKIGTGGMYTGKGTRPFTTSGSKAIINGGTYSGAQGIGIVGNNAYLEINDGNFGTLKYEVIVAASSLKNSSIVINGGTFNSSTQGIIIYNNSDSTNTLTINGGTFDMAGNNFEIDNHSTGIININGGTFTSSSNDVVVNSSSGTMNINGGTFSSSSRLVIRNISTGQVNIKGGIFTSENHQTIQNASTGTINITQTNKPIYISTKSSSNSSIYSISSGIINIKGNRADSCVDNSNATTSGLCVYSKNNSAVKAEKATININGGYYHTDENTSAAINNESGIINIKNAYITSAYSGITNSNWHPSHNTGAPGTINICSSTINGTTYDLNETNTNSYITISNDNTFSNGTNTPDSNKVIGTYNTVNKCPF